MLLLSPLHWCPPPSRLRNGGASSHGELVFATLLCRVEGVAGMGRFGGARVLSYDEAVATNQCRRIATINTNEEVRQLQHNQPQQRHLMAATTDSQIIQRRGRASHLGPRTCHPTAHRSPTTGPYADPCRASSARNKTSGQLGGEPRRSPIIAAQSWRSRTAGGACSATPRSPFEILMKTAISCTLRANGNPRTKEPKNRSPFFNPAANRRIPPLHRPTRVCLDGWHVHRERQQQLALSEAAPIASWNPLLLTAMSCCDVAGSVIRANKKVCLLGRLLNWTLHYDVLLT